MGLGGGGGMGDDGFFNMDENSNINQPATHHAYDLRLDSIHYE